MTVVKGNADKYWSYRVAWSRIDKAIAETFYLEAVTLEESIIADRLISLLSSKESELVSFYSDGTCCRYPRYADLIKKWKKHFPDTLLAQEAEDWGKKRNAILHGMVKGSPGKPTRKVVDFFADAEQIAIDGRKLAKSIASWCRKNKPRSRGGE
jgi:hypothetical protein